MTGLTRKTWALAALLAATGSAAAAQDICGGAGDGGQWIGGSAASSDIATADSYREQMALVLAGNQHVSLFSVSEPGTVRIEAAGRGSGDPLIDILDASGAIIASDDDSGGEGASRAELDLAAGTYCVALSSYDGAPMTAFVRVGTTDQEPLTAGTGDAPDPVIEPTDDPVLPDTPPEDGGSCETAADLGFFTGTPLVNTASVDAAPYYRFTLDSSTALTIRAENEEADPLVTLYDANETYLGENDDYDGLNSQLDLSEPLTAGSYCIAMTALNDTALPITLEISAYDADAAQADLYASGEVAPPMDGSVAITDLGALTSRLREDAEIGGDATWFSIDVDGSGLILMEAIDSTGEGDPYVTVFDDLGRLVTLNDDYGEGFDSLVAIRAQPGTYLIGVRQVDDSFSGLTRMVFERFVPAQ